jgi:hypothetical protein
VTALGRRQQQRAVAAERVGRCSLRHHGCATSAETAHELGNMDSSVEGLAGVARNARVVLLGPWNEAFGRLYGKHCSRLSATRGRQVANKAISAAHIDRADISAGGIG